MHAQSREAVRRLAFIVGLVMVTVAACEGPSLLYQQIEQAVSDAAATADVTSPTIGSPITVGSIGSTTVLLSWGEASDDLTASELIESRVAMATDSGSLGSVELALLADAAMDWTQAATSCAVTDLEPETL